MALEHAIKILGINDAKFTPEDGSAVDFYAIKDLKISGEFTEKEVRGDNLVVGYFSKLDMISVDFSHAAIDLDSIGALTGNMPVDSGTTPSQISTLTVLAKDAPYGKFEGQGTLIDHTTGDKVSDVHFVIYKMKVSKCDIEVATDDLATVSFSGKAIPDPDNNNAVFAIIFNETETAIS